MTHTELTAILDKLTLELEFAASNYGARKNQTSQQYAEMLLDFIKQSQKKQAAA